MADLPSGTVTLLFTDIEGSTRLLQELGRDRYVDALSIHRELVREAFTRHGGVEVEMQGDSFFFGFRSAREAVLAAAAGQRALADHGWSSAPIRVRIGLHTGEPAVVDDLYAGLDVHRAARVMSVAHGGQVIMTRATTELAGDDLPLKDLGEHRLKDIAEPLWLYQLGEAEFPPLRSLNNSNLPTPPSPLIGREAEIADVTASLRGNVRLVTLTGPGGSGKTRLAIDIAAGLVPEFLNGVFFVDLAPLSRREQVMSAIARVLAVREQLSESLQDTLARELADRQLLLVLDNFEHVLDAAPHVAGLLAAAPRLRVLVTTREPLRVAGEHELPLAPLAPDAAAALFVERANAVRPGLITSGHDAEVAAICRRLDNLPLAIELAAARVRLLAPARLLQGLDAALSLLTTGGHDLPERQRTLRATIAWSYDLLDETEQRVFAALSVFAGGCTFEAAESVAETHLETLGSLVEKSLVQTDGERFRMLETIREFGFERLRASQESAVVARRHACFFAALAERTEPELRGPRQGEALLRLEAEYDNMRVAIERAIEHGIGEGVALAGYLVYYWYTRGHWREALETLERLSALATSASPLVRARFLDAHALFLSLRGGHARALELSASASVLAREAGDPATLGNSLVIRQMVTAAADDPDGCAEAAREGIAFARAHDDRLTLAASLSNLAELELGRGRTEECERLATESLELFRSLDDPFNASGVLHILAAAALAKGDVRRAREWLREAAEAARRSRSKERYMWVLDSLGEAAQASGDPGRAARLAGAADALAKEHEIMRFPLDEERRASLVAAATAALGEEAFEQARAEGAALTTEEALELGLGAGPSAT
jgi:predicted ATPase/class 3 adenylate cyclase